MQQFLVQVDSPGDVAAFAQSMQDGKLGCSSAANFAEWRDEIVAERLGPQDARYFVVAAKTEEDIHEAVEDTARYAAKSWAEGRPVFSVLAEREPPSYPA